MDYFLSYLGIEAAGTGIEKTENQITFENFIIQSQELQILKYKPGCIKDFMGRPMQKSPGGLKPVYNVLYDCLVHIGVIEKKTNWGSFLTGSASYTITKDKSKLHEKYIKMEFSKNKSGDFKNIQECYEIHFTSLSNLLKNYKYNTTDQIYMMKPGKKGGKKTKH